MDNIINFIMGQNVNPDLESIIRVVLIFMVINCITAIAKYMLEASFR